MNPEFNLPKNEWAQTVEFFFHSDLGKRLSQKLKAEYENANIYPPSSRVFHALSLTPPEKTRVVILGQDPYHQNGQADGLAFSTPLQKYPPSLRNIFKEALDMDLIPLSGCLTKWAQQGVLLLNRILTVREGKPLSHANMGWEIFTESLLEKLDQIHHPMVFLLWGKEAQSTVPLIQNPDRLILKTSHPSPLSAYRGFLGCGHFRLANEWLKEKGQKTINWQL